MAKAVVATRGEQASARGRALVLSLFLFSGFGALIYQVIWMRLCALLLGTTVYAVSTVVGVFMGGLALGSWLLGRRADRPGANGLRMFGLLELGIGAYALALPTIVEIAEAGYRALSPLVDDSFGLLMVLKISLAAAVLIFPATLMGGTLPVLSRYLVRSRVRSGTEIGHLYAINTLGAVLGCFVAGFFLLEHLGVRRALHLAAAVNLIVGTSALLWARTAGGRGLSADVELDPPTTRYSPRQVRLALSVYACSGFVALALEVLWTRSLLYFTSVDTWAFTAMLSAFLTGLGVGSLVMSRCMHRIGHPLLVLALIEVLIGLSAAASIPLFSWLYAASGALAGALPDTATLSAKIAIKLFCSFFIMLLPTLLMGAAFPLVSVIYVSARRRVGQGVGTLYALNTLGAIGGSLAAAFVLIPWLRLQHAILLCATLYFGLGLVLCAAAPRTPAGRRVGWVMAAAGLVAAVLTHMGFNGRPIILESWFFKDPARPHRLVYLDEGPAASLAVLENANGVRLLNINGVTTAINNHMDMQVHRMLSHLPLLLHPRPRAVLVVGFGMGSTPWGCCQHDVEQVDVIELLRREKETARYFEDINHGVVRHPKLNFIVDDGRNYLLATHTRYDMISFNAIHPRFSASLYTRDFYALCRERLTPDGVICAWMTQNSMKDREFRMLVRSFVDVFPHASLWYCNPEHFCLLGLLKPTEIDLTDWARRMAEPAIARDLADSNLGDPLVLATRYLVGEETLRAYVRGAPLNTDDRPLIEFAREVRDEERPIVERLLELAREEPVPISGGDQPSGRFAELDAYRESALWLMSGQTEFWYRSGPTLRPEIEYRRALLAAPDNQDVRHNLAFSAKVEQEVQAELARDERHLGALLRLGVIRMEQGRLVEAQRHIRGTLTLDNRFTPAVAYLGLVEFLRGDFATARKLLTAVLTGAPSDDPRFACVLGEALVRQGAVEAGTEWKRRAAEGAPEADEWLRLLEQTVHLLAARNGAGAATEPGR